MFPLVLGICFLSPSQLFLPPSFCLLVRCSLTSFLSPLFGFLPFCIFVFASPSLFLLILAFGISFYLAVSFLPSLSCFTVFRLCSEFLTRFSLPFSHFLLYIHIFLSASFSFPTSFFIWISLSTFGSSFLLLLHIYSLSFTCQIFLYLAVFVFM